jgi:hypothetical protein
MRADAPPARPPLLRSEVLQAEAQLPSSFQELPEFYVEISQLLLYQARGIFGGGDESFKVGAQRHAQSGIRQALGGAGTAPPSRPGSAPEWREGWPPACVLTARADGIRNQLRRRAACTPP